MNTCNFVIADQLIFNPGVPRAIDRLYLEEEEMGGKTKQAPRTKNNAKVRRNNHYLYNLAVIQCYATL